MNLKKWCNTLWQRWSILNLVHSVIAMNSCKCDWGGMTNDLSCSRRNPHLTLHRMLRKGHGWGICQLQMFLRISFGTGDCMNDKAMMAIGKDREASPKKSASSLCLFQRDKGAWKQDHTIMEAEPRHWIESFLFGASLGSGWMSALVGRVLKRCLMDNRSDNLERIPMQSGNFPIALQCQEMSTLKASMQLTYLLGLESCRVNTPLKITGSATPHSLTFSVFRRQNKVRGAQHGIWQTKRGGLLIQVVPIDGRGDCLGVVWMMPWGTNCGGQGFSLSCRNLLLASIQCPQFWWCMGPVQNPQLSLVTRHEPMEDEWSGDWCGNQWSWWLINYPIWLSKAWNQSCQNHVPPWSCTNIWDPRQTNAPHASVSSVATGVTAWLPPGVKKPSKAMHWNNTLAMRSLQKCHKKEHWPIKTGLYISSYWPALRFWMEGILVQHYDYRQ